MKKIPAAGGASIAIVTLTIWHTGCNNQLCGSILTGGFPAMPELAQKSDSSSASIFTGVSRARTTERRLAQRSLLCLPAWAIFYRTGREKRLVKVRNMTRHGMFFYSDMPFEPGQVIEFVLRFPRWTNSGPIACRGVVTRVESSAMGSGLAVTLDRCFVLQ
jgi:hypothetical protein